MRLSRILVLPFGLALAATCDTALAAEVAVGIVPPAGWTRVDTKDANLLAAWRDPRAKVLYANLTLAHDDAAQPIDAYAAATSKALATSLPGSTPTLARLTICRDQVAYDVTAVGRYSGVRVRIEELVTEIGGKKFIGTYTRPEVAPDASVAEDALRSICPKTPPDNS